LKYFATLLVFISASASQAQSTVQSIPNQKLLNGSYVSNPDKILEDGTVAQIDTLLKSLEKKTTVQVAVVVVQSIGEADIFDFAQQLFVTWGVGQKENDNGLLLLFVNDQRTIRFHTGFGLEGVLPDVVCKRIQRDFMVPEFKNGNYNAGMLAGLQQVNKILTDPKYAEELKKPEDTMEGWEAFITLLCIIALPILLVIYFGKSAKRKFADSKNPRETDYPEMRMKRWPWLLTYVGLPILITVLIGMSGLGDERVAVCFVTLYVYFLCSRFHRLWRMKKVANRFLKNQQYYEAVEFIRKEQWYWFWMAVLFPFPLLFYFFYHLARKRIYRNYPRPCKQCQTSMNKLSEKKEDEYLTEGMQMEEKLNVVDYDVWKCLNPSCHGIEIWHYLTSQTKYQSCPKCKTMAYHFVSKRTVTSASYAASGSGESVHACEFCGHNAVSTFTIPRYEESSSSSGDSSSSSSSSSSEGSWGGGSSGGVGQAVVGKRVF
jgi:uncharacterized protein